MIKINVLSSKKYDNPDKNYGDCIIIDTGSEVIVYDCGCIEHAKRVISYMDENNVDKIKVVLSHNDSDHYDGIPYLIEEGKVSSVHTVLLLKYKDELLNRINDKRRNRESIGETIKKLYDNIAELSGKVKLIDIYQDSILSSDVVVVGPDKDYMLDVAAKGIDSREGDTIDKETIFNATSVQIEIKFGDKNFLLCGDSSYAAIESILDNYSYIQLPHHGKREQAEKIFEKKSGENKTVYVISDNTGNSNGGSDKLNTRGHIVKNTLSGDIILNSKDNKLSSIGSYGDITI